MLEIREFEADLEWSENMEQWAFYLKALYHFFPDGGQDWERIRDLLRQKQGKDIIIGMTRGQIKARRLWYGDIALEVEHTNGRSWWGWINEPVEVDWLMYCIPSVGKAFLFDMLGLQAVFIENEEAWRARFPYKPSKNHSYHTWNLCVPLSDVSPALIDTADFSE